MRGGPKLGSVVYFFFGFERDVCARIGCPIAGAAALFISYAPRLASQQNTMATMTITVGDQTSAVKKSTTPKPQLYSEHGVPKKEGDPPLGIAYDADGLPVPAHFSVRKRHARSY